MISIKQYLIIAAISFLAIIFCYNCNSRLESKNNANNSDISKNNPELRTYKIEIDTIFELNLTEYTPPYTYEISKDFVYIIADNSTLLVNSKNTWDTIGIIQNDYFITSLIKTDNYFLIGVGDIITDKAFVLDQTSLKTIDTIPDLQFRSHVTKDLVLFVDIYAEKSYYGIIDLHTKDTVKTFDSDFAVYYFGNRYYMEDSEKTIHVYDNDLVNKSSFNNTDLSYYYAFGHFHDRNFGLTREFVRFFIDKSKTQDITFNSELYAQKIQVYDDCLHIFGWSKNESTFRLLHFTIAE